jgi:Bacterial regulatory proteins, tetR family
MVHDPVAGPGENLTARGHPSEDEEGGQHRPIPAVWRNQLAEDGGRAGGNRHLNGRLRTGIQSRLHVLRSCLRLGVDGVGDSQRVHGYVVNCQVRLHGTIRNRCRDTFGGGQLRRYRDSDGTYAELSIERIAEQSGVNKSTIYRRWQSLSPFWLP